MAFAKRKRWPERGSSPRCGRTNPVWPSKPLRISLAPGPKKRAWRDWRQSQGSFLEVRGIWGAKSDHKRAKFRGIKPAGDLKHESGRESRSGLDGCSRIVLRRRRDSARHQCLYRLKPLETMSAARGCCKTKNRLPLVLMVTQRQIETYAADVARKFRPLKIVLFGSYAYGSPTED